MPHIKTPSSLRRASSEELLMLVLFGPTDLKPQIDIELDRRALAGVCSARPASRVLNKEKAA